MPTSAVSPDRRTHSWSFVYFRSLGYAIVSPGRVLQTRGCVARPFVERQWYDRGRRGAAADVDVHACAGRGERRGHVRHCDRLLEKRSLGSARDAAHWGAVLDHGVPVARNAFVDHLETDELTGRAGRFLFPQTGRAVEVGLLPADDAGEPRLDGRGR